MMEQKPVLAVIVVGDNPASAVYVRNKQKAAQKKAAQQVFVRIQEKILHRLRQRQIFRLSVL